MGEGMRMGRGGWEIGQKGNRISQERRIYASEDYSGGNCRKLFTFALLNRDAPHIETIYFVLIEQKKENCLQKLIDVLVTSKHQMIRLANKQLGRLVNVYVMLFVENKNRKETRNKRKTSLPFLPSFVRLLFKAQICTACKCN